jgi:hypothetical protein
MDFPTEMHSPPLARRDELVVQELPEEILVYDLRQHKAHCLNKSAAFIWEQCDGATSVSELTQRVRVAFQSPIDENMVWNTLDRLSEANLLAQSVKRSNAAGRFRSRRAVLGKLGAAATLALPLVTTVIAPMAVQAATIPPVCTNCATGPVPFVCPAACGPTVIGLCYGNSSCQGGGNPYGCMSCDMCRTLSGPGVIPARSWRAGPGTGC